MSRSYNVTKCATRPHFFHIPPPAFAPPTWRPVVVLTPNAPVHVGVPSDRRAQSRAERSSALIARVATCGKQHSDNVKTGLTVEFNIAWKATQNHYQEQISGGMQTKLRQVPSETAGYCPRFIHSQTKILQWWRHGSSCAGTSSCICCTSSTTTGSDTTSPCGPVKYTHSGTQSMSYDTVSIPPIYLLGLLL